MTEPYQTHLNTLQSHYDSTAKLQPDSFAHDHRSGNSEFLQDSRNWNFPIMILSDDDLSMDYVDLNIADLSLTSHRTGRSTEQTPGHRQIQIWH